ncbi:MAG TPA: FGGY family carbohydrate kinase [Atribacteraceae bacterium]|nr:FGGY family carbohydrate kinase [Atribacteraceae bacterium]
MVNMTEARGVLVLDVGTESVRAALVGTDGTIHAMAGGNPAFSSPRPGWAEQSPAEWWDLSRRTIRQLTAGYPDFAVLGIGVSAQMHACIPVDGAGTLLMEQVPIWCDKRSSALCREVETRISPATQIQKTANLLLPAWTGPKMRWVAVNQPEVYAGTRYFLTAKDYINHCLTGEFVTDYSEASGSFLFSWEQKLWDPDLVDLFGLDRHKLPPVVASSEIIGNLTAERAAELGLRPGLPVICGAGDMLCLLLGGGMARHGSSCDVTGTAADVSIFSPVPLLTERLMNLHHAIDGWISFGILDSGGGSLKWLKDALYDRGKGNKASYREIDGEAGSVPPGAEGLLYFPYLLGERLLGSPHARGSFFGLLPGHRRGHFARAVMEGVCFDLRMSLEEIERLYGEPVKEMSVIGGGAKSDLWCQIKADIYGKPMYTLEEAEGGIVGAAMLTFSAVSGESVSGLAARWLTRNREFTPIREACPVYDQNYSRFRRFHDLFQEAYRHYSDDGLK